MSEFALPSRELAALQHEWLSAARARILRMARIARRQQVLDLGCGWGLASQELARRGGRPVTAIDVNHDAIRYLQQRGSERIIPVAGDAHELPFNDASFDLVFTQFAFLWFANVRQVVGEVRRVLRPGGVAVSIEPDFGGMMVYPTDIQLAQVWIEALDQNGAHPQIGRELAYELSQAGFHVTVRFSDQLRSFDVRSLLLLGELPLQGRLARQRDNLIEQIGGQQDAAEQTQPVVHLPLWLSLAER